MTRKNYIEIADSFRHLRPAEGETSALMMWELLRREMADILKRDNSRFDRDRFYAATEGSSK